MKPIRRARVSDEEVRRIHADYVRLKSLKKAAALHGRRFTTIYVLMKSRGLIQRTRTRSLPSEVVAAMYAAYRAGRSLEQVGEAFGRTRQSVYDTFKRRGLKLRGKVFLAAIEYGGRKFTSQKTGGRHRYLRDTIHRAKTRYLHHLVWEEHHGPIPKGHKIAFRDGNHLNVAMGNLELLTNSEQVRKYAAKGQNAATKSAPVRLSTLLAKHDAGGSVGAQLQRRARA